MLSLEDQIRKLMEARQEADKEQADRVDDEPAVKIDNPMDPNLASSEGLTPDQQEAEKAEGTDGGDANEREVNAKKKAEGMREETKDDEKTVAEEVAVEEKEDDKCEDTEKCEEAKCEEDEKSETVAEADTTLVDLLGQEFSEEFKLQAQTIFEAAVKDKVATATQKLEEEFAAKTAKIEEDFNTKSASMEKEFQEKFEAQVKHIEEETSEKIDGYLSYVAEEWTTKNELALEAGIKTELTESFIDKLKTLFEQHYIDLPESKVDLYKQAIEEKAGLEQEVATIVASMKTLKEELDQIKRANIIEESVKELSSLDASRFNTLVEDFVFEDEETFKKKVAIVKKSFFENKQSVAKEQLAEELVKTEVITETNSTTDEIIQENTAMSAYLKALKK